MVLRENKHLICDVCKLCEEKNPGFVFDDSLMGFMMFSVQLLQHISMMHKGKQPWKQALKRGSM